MLSNVRVVAANGAPAVIKALDKAIRLALTDATQAPKAEIKRRLRGGYTSGNFVTGVVWNSVRTERAAKDGQGVYTTRIGTNRDYALYWELGHHNAYTRRYERVEVWKPAIIATREETAAMFARLVRKSLKRDLQATEAQIDRLASGVSLSSGDIEVTAT